MGGSRNLPLQSFIELTPTSTRTFTRTSTNIYPTSSVWFGSVGSRMVRAVQSGSVRSNSVRFVQLWCSPLQSGSVQFNLLRFDPLQHAANQNVSPR